MTSKSTGTPPRAPVPSSHGRAGLLAALTALALAAGLACGGGGGGGGGGGPTPPPPPGITFTAAGTAANSIAAVRTGTEPNRLVLQLRAEGVTNLYGAAFDLEFPANLFTFVAATEGEFLQSATTATSFQAVQTSPGRLVVGVTRLGQASGVTGTGVLLTVELTATAAGTGTIRFVNQRAVRSDGLAVGGLQWFGGSVQVTL